MVVFQQDLSNVRRGHFQSKREWFALPGRRMLYFECHSVDSSWSTGARAIVGPATPNTPLWHVLLCLLSVAEPGLRQQGRRRTLAPKTYMERRQLTVMFCDLVGSTNLSLGLDPEDYTSIVRAYRDASVRVIRHWKGYTARYVGDGLLTYFGYTAHPRTTPFGNSPLHWSWCRWCRHCSYPNSGLRAERRPT